VGNIGFLCLSLLASICASHLCIVHQGLDVEDQGQGLGLSFQGQKRTKDWTCWTRTKSLLCKKCCRLLCIMILCL